MQENFHKILIIRTDRIGDVILTLPMAYVLKKNNPNAHVSMLIQKYTFELVEENINVDDIIFYDNGKSRIPAGIPMRIGTGYRWYSFMFNKKVYEHRRSAGFHELEYNLHLLNAIGYKVEDGTIMPSLQIQQDAKEKVDSLLKEFGIQSNHKLVILHPGSGRSSRDWSKKNFGILGRQLSELSDVKVVVTGGKSEQRLVEEVQIHSANAIIPLVNRLTLNEYGALAKHATLFIANSTGPIHIAAAVGTMVIGLYPQVKTLSAARWGPYTKKKIIFTPVNKQTNCKKCLHSKDGSCECMDSITVDEVFTAAKKYLLENSSERIS
ncbi:MAG: glycosyltransferase family 9 protein [Ignavibacteriales bacterium]|nr:glycosyltransferase family 9 protein [Ignavibacteriales bacterium]